jgi:hypothetical protein
MPQLETGVFAFMLVFSFGFMIWGFLRQASIFTNVLRMISLAAFFGLALYMASGYEVASTTVMTSSTGVTETTKSTLIPANDAAWMSWLFMGFGILNIVLVIREVFKR